MEGGNSRAATYEAVFGSLANQVGRAETPVFIAPGLRFVT